MKTTKLNNGATPIVAQAEAESKRNFSDLIRAYEESVLTGDESGAALYELAKAVALSVIAKCVDPQRKRTDGKDVSHGGLNPAMVALRREVIADYATLEATRTMHNAATAIVYTKDGDTKSEVVDADADRAAKALQELALGDGIDLVHTAVVAILEQTAEHATPEPGWMERPYTGRRLSRKVLIKSSDSAKWIDEECVPISEVYREVRRAVQNSRAVQTDSRSGYCYIEDMAVDPDSNATETVYRRLHKWADIGGYTNTGHYDAHGNASRGGLYTVSAQNTADYAEVLAALNLTERQATIVRLRMSGYGYKAIGAYIGVSFQAVQNTVNKVRAKCEKIGFTPEMWAEMTMED